MNLSERKKNILKAVINETIKTAEPVSSSELQRDYLKDVSSATIRNELAALEEMGFLVQPHTSSGRLPTIDGYKKYVQELMTEQKLTKKEADKIKENFSLKMKNMGELLESTAKVIADASNYASIVSLGVTNNAIIKNVLLVRLDEKQILAVLVTDMGTMKEIVNIKSISEEDLSGATKYLQNKMIGKKLLDVEDIFDEIPDELTKYKNLFECIVEAMIDKNQEDKNNMVVAGKEKLLDYPEYQDVNNFKKALKDLKNKDTLKTLMNSDDDLEISIKVADDSGEGKYSVVTAKYKINGKLAGTASVLGPVRMDYGKVVSILKNVTNQLEENIAKNSDEE